MTWYLTSYHPRYCLYVLATHSLSISTERFLDLPLAHFAIGNALILLNHFLADKLVVALGIGSCYYC
jgi:hypothetical protein